MLSSSCTSSEAENRSGAKLTGGVAGSRQLQVPWLGWLSNFDRTRQEIGPWGAGLERRDVGDVIAAVRCGGVFVAR